MMFEEKVIFRKAILCANETEKFNLLIDELKELKKKMKKDLTLKADIKKIRGLRNMYVVMVRNLSYEKILSMVEMNKSTIEMMKSKYNII